MGAIAAVGDAVETVRVEPVLAAARVAAGRLRRGPARRSWPNCAAARPPTAATAPPLDLRGRAVVLVDDGLATGATMRAAVVAVRRQAPDRITVAVPVGSPTACAALAADVDEVVCLRAPLSFRAVGQAYDDFARPPTRRSGPPSPTAAPGCDGSTSRGSLFPCSHPGLDSDRATL